MMSTHEHVSGGGVTSPLGFSAGAVKADIKGAGAEKLDLGLLCSNVPAVAAGVFTLNKVSAAPVRYSRARLAGGQAQAVVFNSGNANACTGEQGMRDAERMAELAATRLGIPAALVQVASTGVIGVPLPMGRIGDGLARLTWSREGGRQAAEAIMTTDTFAKEVAVRLTVGGRVVTVGGMAKGSGMIHPNMATMLGFLTTDASLEGAYAAHLLRRVADATFNMVSVDGDTSTNDTLLLLANGESGTPVLRGGDAASDAFAAALHDVARDLTIMLARDGEGATKVIEVRVQGAESIEDARRVAMAVAQSPLVKTAVYGGDPNWGRIACAAGYSGAALDQERLDVAMAGALLMRQGTPLAFNRDEVVAALKGASQVLIEVDLHLGSYQATAWGCDLTEGYVDINGHYTT
ncbi:MAG TPA: bifunctional glutamate N-acetyltransferase/amino-acid acetyltransferase ArgJ [Chloroflexota bacterium]|jgi:glutamate N-acetyltransferase/amino-acid N-acetyltransferase|nr:bifunctional glutamate N-acetyltransferase/amino-acid acetyltransferase ArgJ [Chloroflexota bacterium]